MENKEKIDLNKSNDINTSEQSLHKPKNKAKSSKKQELWRVVKFVLFSASAAIIQLGSSFLLKLAILGQFIPDSTTIHFITETSLSSFIAETVGLVLSVLWNCTFNRKYTFKSSNNLVKSMLLALLFYVPFYPFQIWYMATIEKALVGIGDWGFIIAQVTVMLINFVLEFLWQTFVVFRNSIDSNVKQKAIIKLSGRKLKLRSVKSLLELELMADEPTKTIADESPKVVTDESPKAKLLKRLKEEKK